MADDTRRAYAQSARGEPAAGWGEPSLGGGERESVGERLKRERETYGLHLREVSESLRIRYAYLDAIERSAFDELPGPTYAVGFVRGYAQFLGLDDDRIVQRFKDESQGLKRDQELHFPEPVNEGKIPGATILVLSIALIAAAYGAWAYLSDGERSVADLVPEVPESLQRMVGATEEPPVPEATDLTGTRTSEPATDETASGDPASGDPASGDMAAGEGTAGDGLETEQVAELPETAPDPDLSGDTGATAGDSQSTAAPDVADGGSARAPETDGTDGTAAQRADESSDLPDMPDAPEPDTAGGSDPTAAQDQAAGEPAPDAPEPAGDTQTAATPEDAQPDSRAGTQSADQSGQQTDTQSGAQAAEGGDNPAPPAVPEMQQDDSGIPTAPDQTQTASTDGAGAGTDGRTFGASPGNSRVTLVATARSWVQVRGPDDSLVLTRLLRPGDRYNVPDRPGLTLHTGNAGGLQVMVDGRELGDLGADGEVRRGILLEPQALTAGG
jgi:cytoskeleton protein RodZ